MEIPILSVSQIGLKNEAQPSLEAFKLCGGNLKRAFSSVGFIYIKDHGIDEKLIEKSMEASKNYFQLPQDVKESFPRFRERKNQIFDKNYFSFFTPGTQYLINYSRE